MNLPEMLIVALIAYIIAPFFVAGFIQMTDFWLKLR